MADSTGWSEPEQIPVSLENANLLVSNIAQSRGSVFVTYQTSSNKKPFPNDVWVIENRNGSWNHPQKAAETSLTLTGSKIAVTQQGENEIIHLVWGDQPSDINFDYDHPPSYSASNYILYSYHNSETWSAPDTLFHTPKRSLRFGSNLVSDKEGVLYFPFTAFDSTDTQKAGYTTFMTKLEKNKWMSPIPVATSGGDNDMEILNDGTFLLSYIRADSAWVQKNLRPDVNSIFVKTSSDAGKTWKETRIQRSGNTPAHRTKIAADESNRIHLIWRQDTVGDRMTNNIAHSWSEDGYEWTEPEILIKSSEASSGHINNHDIVVSNSGTVHLLFVVKDGLGNSNGRMYHASWNGNSWNISEPLFDFPGFGHLSVTYDERKKQLHLVFTAKPDNQEQEHPWKLYYSVFQE